MWVKNNHLAQKPISSNGDVSVEKTISAYGLESVSLSNAEHVPPDTDGGFVLGGLHIITVETKDIKEDEEIVVTYGHDYWMIHKS